MQVIEFNGKLISEKTMPLQLKANTGAVYFTNEVEKFLAGTTADSALLSVLVTQGAKQLSENILYFLPIKDVKLPKVTIKKTLTTDKDHLVLKLKSDRLVKNLYLSVDEGDGFFSDNYFDVLPGEEVVIRFKPHTAMSKKMFETSLRMMHMAEI
jgi:beta-mannosidase